MSEKIENLQIALRAARTVSGPQAHELCDVLEKTLELLDELVGAFNKHQHDGNVSPGDEYERGSHVVTDGPESNGRPLYVGAASPKPEPPDEEEEEPAESMYEQCEQQPRYLKKIEESWSRIAKMAVKCRHCGRRADDHNAADSSCPLGRKHRTVGFTSYHHSQTFEPKPVKDKKAVAPSEDLTKAMTTLRNFKRKNEKA